MKMITCNGKVNYLLYNIAITWQFMTIINSKNKLEIKLFNIFLIKTNPQQMCDLTHAYFHLGM